MRGNGERIGPQNLPTSSVAGGIWNLLNQQRAQQRGAWPSATPAVTTDPYFMYVPLLLNTTSTNAQQNNTFLDSSSNTFTITRNGTPTQGAFTPYQPSGYWSGVFNGTTDYLTYSAPTMGSGNYTVEFWVNPNELLANGCIYDSSNGLMIRQNTAGFLAYDRSTATILASSTSGASIGAWIHVAVVRNSGNVLMYVNGVASGAAVANTTNYTDTSFLICRFASGGTGAGNQLNGYLSNLRVVKGVAVYTGTFTPPTAPLAATQSAGTNISAITGTQCSLLICSSNRFIDIGGQVTPNVITANGTPKVQAFQPFAPAASYSAATYGGSGWFDYTGNYLNLASNSAFSFAGDYSIEGWGYQTVTNNGQAIYGTGGAGSNDQLFIDPVTQYMYYGGIQSASGTADARYQWGHFLITRSGSTLRLFSNGKLVANGTLSGTQGSSVTGPRIADRAGTGAAWGGYLCDVRVCNGSIPTTYQTSSVTNGTQIFTPPSSPVTTTSQGAISSNVKLLTNFTNAGIYDAAWQNNALTVGDAQVSTTQAQWPTTSMKFDGTGDYLDLGSNQAFVMGSGNWTVESWVYPTSTSAGHWMYLQGNSTAYGAIRIGCQSNQVFLLISTNGSSFTVSSGLVGSVPINAWTYLAVTRSGGTVTLYVNGTSVYTSTALSTSSLMTGIYNLVGRIDPTNLQYFNGYIQDLRITKGVARTITTPTAAFPTR